MAQDVQHYSNGTMSLRNLKKGDLCGVIFGCKFNTIKECLAKKLFGLPASHMAYIQNIDPGLTLFLFNYSDRTLHGIYEAASAGKLNIDPKAWSPNATDPSPFPAQVKIRVRVRCEPLVEEKFRSVIAENYMDEKLFWFELDRGQTNKLLRLFSPSPTSKVAALTSRKAICASAFVEIGDLGATRVDKWSSLFKSSDDSSENKGKDTRVVNLGKTRGWEVAAKNANERKAEPSMSQSVGASYSSVLRNITESSSTNVVLSQASKGDTNPSRAWPLRQDNIIAQSKEDYTEDTYSEIDWDDDASFFKVHLDGLNEILDDPTDTKDGFKMVPNHWEDERVSWEFEERNNTDKTPSGSSYVSAMTGDDIGDDKEKHFKMEMGSSTLIDIVNEILLEVKELKQNQMKQDEYMISLEMDLLETRKEILRLKGRYASS